MDTSYYDNIKGNNTHPIRENITQVNTKFLELKVARKVNTSITAN